MEVGLRKCARKRYQAEAQGVRCIVHAGLCCHGVSLQASAGAAELAAAQAKASNQVNELQEQVASRDAALAASEARLAALDTELKGANSKVGRANMRDLRDSPRALGLAGVICSWLGGFQLHTFQRDVKAQKPVRLATAAAQESHIRRCICQEHQIAPP